MARHIRSLQIDVTTVCQAACPCCAREINPAFDKSIKHHLTVDRLTSVFPLKKIKRLEKMHMCGNYGEPAAGYHTQDIFNYFREVNPSIVLGMNTNGGVQSTFWWHGLGKILNREQDYCVFSIDGLADTNAVYRRNVSWDRVMANVESFISAGGMAHWDMLIYKHNQHQVDDCEQLARRMGFRWFRAKVSKRPHVNGLEFPIGWNTVGKIGGKIQCHALDHKSEYIDAYGNLSPCCWHGMTLKPNADGKKIADLQATWKTNNPDPVCQEACSIDRVKTRFASQWQREIQLAWNKDDKL